MTPDRYFREVLLKTRIIQSPSRRIATFGDTKIKYFFISGIKGYEDRSRLRQGIVLAERPKIITPEAMKERYEGFDRPAQEFGDWLTQNFGQSFRALEYRFKNQDHTSSIEHTEPGELAAEIPKRLTPSELGNSVILTGPDKAWQVSLMKFIFDECGASFHTNVRDLEVHGFFDKPDQVRMRQRSVIEDLFRKCREDKSNVSLLGRKLQELGLFAEYQDDFFKLIK